MFRKTNNLDDNQHRDVAVLPSCDSGLTMTGLLDWITDGGLTSSVFGGGAGASQPMPPVQPMDNSPPTAPASPQATMPPVQPLDMTTGPGTGGQPQPPGAPSPPPAAQAPIPLPQPRPAAADAALPPNATPTSGPGAQSMPGAPVSLAPPGNGTNGVGPGLGVGTEQNVSNLPGQTWLGRALGITPDQAGKQGQQIGAGLAQGLKAVGSNWNKPGLAALAGTAGAAMQGGQKQAEVQAKQSADYLKAAIDAKKNDDERAFKINYLRYLVTKQQADNARMASKDATGANKNDSPTQLYLSAQRLVQPERNALNKQIDQMRKDGADPAAIAKAQADGEAAISAKLNDHYATLGIHPQTAAQIARQPGNSQANPINGNSAGLTADNISKRLQPGQWFTNPSDGKLYRYKGDAKVSGGPKKSAPDKPANPEPADPMNKTAISTGTIPGDSDTSSEEDE